VTTAKSSIMKVFPRWMEAWVRPDVIIEGIDHAQIMERLPQGSLVINATGMGKDTPGSPLTDQGLFPRNGIAWEINYRGELDFWQQAMAQKESRNLFVEYGWLYFLHGWTQVIAEVLHIELDEKTFARLGEIAADLRPPLVCVPRPTSTAPV
jgi:shikimate 5-dehydrogenase